MQLIYQYQSGSRIVILEESKPKVRPVLKRFIISEGVMYERSYVSEYKLNNKLIKVVVDVKPVN